MIDCLADLLDQNEILYGITCRDPSETDLELLSQVGYQVIWVDLEHGAISDGRAMKLCRTITHLGMIPLARIIELNRSQVQMLLDVGYRILILPSVTDAQQAQRFVELGKYPPLGQRGVSSTAAGNEFSLGTNPVETLEEANAVNRLMVQFESDTSYDNIDAILAVEGVDMVTIGPLDWALSLGLTGDAAKRELAPKIEKILMAALKANKITAMGVTNAEQARHYVAMGVRILFAGVDIAVKKKAFRDWLSGLRA
jgi:2-keto-3-deoxy-L-rhamnonate aldolase RhmA